MANRIAALAAAASLLVLQCGAGRQAHAQYQGNQGGQYQGGPYQGGQGQGGTYQGGQGQGGQGQRSGNAMGYRMLSSQEAGGLPRGGATLGLDVESTQQINEQGLSFSVLRVKQVRQGSPAAAGGLQRGDNLIAVNGYVFPGIREFAQYVGSLSPGTSMTVDFIPAGSRPDNAQRVSLRLGGQGGSQDRGRYAQGPDEKPTGMSTRMKLGLGAAALFGCYELGCFSSRNASAPQQGNPGPQGYPQQGYQQRP